jgi:hypothetical protein
MLFHCYCALGVSKRYRYPITILPLHRTLLVGERRHRGVDVVPQLVHNSILAILRVRLVLEVGKEWMLLPG